MKSANQSFCHYILPYIHVLFIENVLFVDTFKDFISLCPAIQPAAHDIHFFDNNDNYQKGLYWYRRQMPLTGPGELLVEAIPGYFVSEVSPQRIHNMNSSIKLIVILRNPTDHVISQYVSNRKNKKRPESKYTLEQMI